MRMRLRKKTAKKAVSAHYSDLVRGSLPPEVTVRIKCTFTKKKRSSVAKEDPLSMEQLMLLVSMGAANYSVGTKDVDFDYFSMRFRRIMPSLPIVGKETTMTARSLNDFHVSNTNAK